MKSLIMLGVLLLVGCAKAPDCQNDELKTAFLMCKESGMTILKDENGREVRFSCVFMRYEDGK